MLLKDESLPLWNYSAREDVDLGYLTDFPRSFFVLNCGHSQLAAYLLN